MIDDQAHLVKYGWNEYAKRVTSDRQIFEEYDYLLTFIKDLTPGAKILDVGCGSGIPITKYLIEKGFAVTGIDISEEQVKKAKIRLPSGVFAQMNLEDIDFPENSFQAIICLHTIYHTPKVTHLSTLKKFFKILKPDGTLMITLGCEDWEGIRELYEEIKMFWSHFNKEDNIQMIIESGFSIIYKNIYNILGKDHLLIIAKKTDNPKSSSDEKIIYSS
jgi:SAM-dependent methyltransferase